MLAPVAIAAILARTAVSTTPVAITITNNPAANPANCCGYRYHHGYLPQSLPLPLLLPLLPSYFAITITITHTIIQVLTAPVAAVTTKHCFRLPLLM